MLQTREPSLRRSEPMDIQSRSTAATGNLKASRSHRSDRLRGKASRSLRVLVYGLAAERTEGRHDVRWFLSARGNLLNPHQQRQASRSALAIAAFVESECRRELPIEWRKFLINLCVAVAHHAALSDV